VTRTARWISFVAGLLFAVGLGVSGMTDPRKVLGFLDVFGQWDASLALVMAGAIGVHLPFLRLVRARRPMATPGDDRIGGRLVLGAVVFGVGWGLSGYCPGPALVSLASGRGAVLVFVVAMVAGSFAARSTVDASGDGSACGAPGSTSNR
jgi:uncharacterized membrane protein YedE/YeeE